MGVEAAALPDVAAARGSSAILQAAVPQQEVAPVSLYRVCFSYEYLHQV